MVQSNKLDILFGPHYVSSQHALEHVELPTLTNSSLPIHQSSNGHPTMSTNRAQSHLLLTCTVLRFVIVAVHTELSLSPHGHLGHEGHQVVRRPLGVLSNPPRFMCTNWIEIPQQYSIEVLKQTFQFSVLCMVEFTFCAMEGLQLNTKSTLVEVMF